MNADDILDALEQVDDYYIKKAREPMKKNHKPLWISVGTLAACLVLVVLLPNVISPLLDSYKGIDITPTPAIGEAGREYKPFALASTDEGIYWSWDCQTVARRFSFVTYNDVEYRLQGSYLEEDMKVSASLIGKKLADTTTEGYDWKNDITHTMECSLYEITGVDSDRFLAVQYADEEHAGDYYVFMQHEFNPPATLGDFITSLNLTETLPLTEFSYKTYDYTEKKGESETYSLSLADSKVVWEMISKYTAVGTSTDEEHGYTYNRITFSVSSEALGLYNRSFDLTADGYLSTSIENYRYTFYLGEEAVEEIRDYILSHKTDAPKSDIEYLYGVVTEIGEDYIKVDDSILMKDPEDGMEFTVYAHDMRVKRYIISDYLKVGDHVQIQHYGLSSSEPTIVRTAFLLNEGGFVFEEDGYSFLIPE